MKQTKTKHNGSSSLLIGCSAIIAFLSASYQLIQSYAPLDQHTFLTSLVVVLSFVFVIISDPVSVTIVFLPVLEPILPASWIQHVKHSNQCLLVAEEQKDDSGDEIKEKKLINGDKEETDDNKEHLVCLDMLYREILHRMQWHFVIPAAVADAALRAVHLTKPSLIGKLFDSVVQPNANMETAFWPYIQPLIVLAFLDYILIAIRDYCQYAALHRFRAAAQTEMIQNLLNQEMEYLSSEKHRAGLMQLLQREVNRLNKVVNNSLPKLVGGTVMLLGGIGTVLRSDWRMAFIGLFLKAPILVILQKWARVDLNKYRLLYEKSEGEAKRIASMSLDLGGGLHLIQSIVAQNRMVNRYSANLEDFIGLLRLTHLRQTFLFRESLIPCALGSGTGVQPNECRGEVSLCSVGFAYRLNPKHKILDSVDLHLRPGKVVALVGKSGKK
mmetsp:Transcript_41672/g.48604  ORF Transcript_41672/g.48604 Transcript_41672/m.48604 type:complete len:441 (+) Transcript_41672:29-1351(+)